jgi:uncharacterized membrane protein YbhN (UPF0104 family)
VIPVNRRRVWSLVLTMLACGLLILLVRQTGLRVIVEQWLKLGSVLPAILTLTFFKFPLAATSWRLVLPPGQRPPWWRTLRTTLGGEAIGGVTLAGPFAAEPMRAALMKQFLPLSTSIAAGAVHRSVYASTGALVTAAALWIVASRFGRYSWHSALAAAVVAVLPLAVALLAKRHGSRRSAVDPTEWRGVVRGLWSDRRGTLHVIALLCLAEHGIMFGEAFVMLDALGAQPTLATVLMFEGASKLANSVGVLVPGRLGIAEGGSAAVATALGIGSSIGVALVLTRRVRGLLWSIVGVTLVVPDLWRMSRVSGERMRHGFEGGGAPELLSDSSAIQRSNECRQMHNVLTGTQKARSRPDRQ